MGGKPQKKLSTFMVKKIMSWTLNAVRYLHQFLSYRKWFWSTGVCKHDGHLDITGGKDRLYFLCDSGALNMLIQWDFSQNTPSPQKAAFVQFHTAVGKLKTVGFITHLWFFGFDGLVALFQVLVEGETNNSNCTQNN